MKDTRITQFETRALEAERRARLAPPRSTAGPGGARWARLVRLLGPVRRAAGRTTLPLEPGPCER